MSLSNKQKLTRLLFAAVAAIAAQTATFAQTDTANVPFVVNVNAIVSAVPASGTTAVVTQVQMTVTANTQATLRIPLPKTTGVVNGAQRQITAPTIVNNGGGKVTINLPSQSYKNAEIALYSVNGKRILRKDVSASNTANTIYRKNAAPVVYLLSVNGTGGATFASRLTHSGGNFDIHVIFGGENHSSQLPKKMNVPTNSGSWAVTVGGAAGHIDTTYAFSPVNGTNPLQNITLRTVSSGGGGSGTVADSRDGKTYRAVTIGNQTWMAENLNYQTLSGSWCYGNSADSCKKYGRLYDWATAMGIDTSYNYKKWGGSDVKRQGICPAGWHLPSRREWGDLAIAAGGNSGKDNSYGTSGVAGTRLKSTSGWDDFNGTNGGGTDDYGFSALPGGFSNFCIGSGSYWVGIFGHWRTATEWENAIDAAHMRTMTSGGIGVGENEGHNSLKCSGFSVRCVRD
jgi:uncharacterized protein (TIGR02145 family)